MDWYKLRKKENKSEEEQLLLDFKHSFSVISEILVSNSKLHINDEDAIEAIRKVLSDITHKL